MIADAISERSVKRSADEASMPNRSALGEHKVHVRLTVDLVPEIMVIVHREGESPNLALAASAEETEPSESVPEALEVPEAEEVEGAEEVMEVEDAEASQAETTP
jgi:large subunit ribosomal protein L9